MRSIEMVLLIINDMGGRASWPKACMEWKAKQGDKMNQMLNVKQR